MWIQSSECKTLTQANKSAVVYTDSVRNKKCGAIQCSENLSTTKYKVTQPKLNERQLVILSKDWEQHGAKEQKRFNLNNIKMKTVGCSRRTITCTCSTNLSAFIIEIWGVITGNRYHSLLKCSQRSGNSCQPTCKANPETYCWTLLAELDGFFFQSVSVFVDFLEECLKNVLIYTPIWKEQSCCTKTTSTQILLNS